MREPLKDPIRLNHILEAAEQIVDANRRLTLDAIEKDPILFFGIVKLVEIIGEASYKLSKEFKSAHPELPWREIEGMRHVLVHDYYTIDSKILWDTITESIPPLIPTIRKIISESKE